MSCILSKWKKKNQIIEIELDEISHTINTYIHTYLCIYVYIYMQQKRINGTNFILSFLETSLPCPGSNVILPWARQVRFLHYVYIKKLYKYILKTGWKHQTWALILECKEYNSLVSMFRWWMKIILQYCK